jgi:transcriptional regulator with XRE-family HTH domain
VQVWQDQLVVNLDGRAEAIRIEWGKAIAEQRTVIGKSRQWLADQLGISAAAVGMWERGETAPRPHHQAAIAKALMTTPRNLFKLDAAA